MTPGSTLFVVVAPFDTTTQRHLYDYRLHILYVFHYCLFDTTDTHDESIYHLWPIMPDFKVGQQVEISDGRVGTLKYFGPIDGKAGDFIGIELKEATGKNDGRVQGKRYFDCVDGYGIFVKPAVVSIVAQSVATRPAPARKPARPSSVNAGISRASSTSNDTTLSKRKSLNAPSPSPGPKQPRPSSISRVSRCRGTSRHYTDESSLPLSSLVPRAPPLEPIHQRTPDSLSAPSLAPQSPAQGPQWGLRLPLLELLGHHQLLRELVERRQGRQVAESRPAHAQSLEPNPGDDHRQTRKASLAMIEVLLVHQAKGPKYCRPNRQA